MPTQIKKQIIQGFTLVELLVVIAILGVLSVVGLSAFNTSQMRGRDAERKSDLKQIASALELYYSDYNSYPGALNGQVLGCPSNTETACVWGADQFTDGRTIYMSTLPIDPASDLQYYYRTVEVNGINNQGFQLYARLENTRDISSCLSGDCGSHTELPSGVSCGSTGTCNFSITSPNTTYDTE